MFRFWSVERCLHFCGGVFFKSTCGIYTRPTWNEFTEPGNKCPSVQGLGEGDNYLGRRTRTEAARRKGWGRRKWRSLEKEGKKKKTSRHNDSELTLRKEAAAWVSTGLGWGCSHTFLYMPRLERKHLRTLQLFDFMYLHFLQLFFSFPWKITLEKLPQNWKIVLESFHPAFTLFLFLKKMVY